MLICQYVCHCLSVCLSICTSSPDLVSVSVHFSSVRLSLLLSMCLSMCLCLSVCLRVSLFICLLVTLHWPIQEGALGTRHLSASFLSFSYSFSGGSKRGERDTPPGGPNSFNFMQFWGNLAKSYVGAPPPPPPSRGLATKNLAK